MKRAFALLTMLVLITNESFSKGIVLEFSTSGYFFNKQELFSNERSCLLVNVFATDVIMEGNIQGCRPLVVLQVFDFHTQTYKEKETHGFENVISLISAEILPILKKDMAGLNITDIINTSPIESSTMVADSILIIEKGVKCLITGFIKIDFFNVVEYEQFHCLQVNQTILNINALTAPVNNWTADSIPVFSLSYIDRKIFLQRKDSSDYLFYKFPQRDEDDMLAFPAGFLYRKEFGVIAIRSKHISWNREKGRLLPVETLIVSNGYYFYQ